MERSDIQEIVQSCGYIHSQEYVLPEEEKKIEISLRVFGTKCKAFGFTDNTPEMAKCLLELYKIANQPQQKTLITNSVPA